MKKTALYQEHVKLGAKIVEFGGWLMPVFYTNVIDEHITTRTKAGLFDICHMGEIMIEGDDAFRLVQKLFTADISKLTKGGIVYCVMCNENGGAVDDLTVYCFDKNKYMLVVNAGTVDKDLEWVKKCSSGFDVAVTDKRKELAKLDLQGPNAEAILQKMTKANLNSLKRFGFIENEVNGVKAIISRTGYTAEDGFEIYFGVNKAVEIWNRLLTVGKESGIKPVGLGARDTLRLEACYSLYGHELDDSITPIEAGISFVVDNKDNFVGKEALIKQKMEGAKRLIMAFEMTDKAVPRNGYEIFKGNRKVGYVTSGTMSPTFKKGIGLGMVEKDNSKTGNEIEIKIRDKLYKAVIVKRPFYEYKGGNK
ncbi:glycine cleavage system aminomethyltransferase GcvT [Candidatus Woesearchaeota archaeon]|nr:glycine cleavage system aminomethyltransferase GcvT [Candidatus Woesearchaeota archaeon]